MIGVQPSFDWGPVENTAVTPDLTGVRRTLRRALAAALLVEIVLGWSLLIATVVGINLQQGRADKLLGDGVPTPGTVVAVHGQDDLGSVEVTYLAAQIQERGKLELDSNSPRYHVGEHLSLLVDPGDPRHFRTELESNDPAGQTWLLVFGVVLGPTFILIGLVLLLRRAVLSRTVKAGPWARAQLYRLPAQGRRRIRSVIAVQDGTDHVNLALIGGVWWLPQVRAALEQGLLVTRKGRRLAAVTPDGQLVKRLRMPRGASEQLAGRRYAQTEQGRPGDAYGEAQLNQVRPFAQST
ncbi:MAG: hypothetical protein JWL79_2372 [Frankiales bacterium]|nr:hypothetical protein [Frankiales bacterium]